MRELFIYYRLRSSDPAAALAVVLSYQALLRTRHPALIARLLHRPIDGGALQTWMETYSTDPMREPTGISPEIQSEIEAQALALLPMLTGTRHTEVFSACVS